MIKLIKHTMVAALFTMSLAIGQAYAHGAHGAHFKAEDVIDLASRYVTTIVNEKHKIEEKVLDVSWLNVPDTAKTIELEKDWYFVVKFFNASEKQSLYMLISKKGKLFRANFNGDFKDINN